ncbi:Zinc ribbon domain protein [Pirellula sp. SH-Sr6A]|uniref:FmdB family zinc ribbon protein n=1 Tax=Pirellula sp. SH-Sr6A TaxID=1632865 RepID=UPI00078ED23F|nr:zinc ribbon domain-containing protein [Pirellula sp. SH-Sr6A]AMV31924.1 Zinc ribbon domain protein [Pirellula sp. SH-Sr6A]
MPLYEYECKRCKKQSELLVSKPDAKVECPECGAKEMTKQLSVVSAPVMATGGRGSSPEPGPCGRSECASGCMFDN